jgi:hypothetical protein
MKKGTKENRKKMESRTQASVDGFSHSRNEGRADIKYELQR